MKLLRLFLLMTLSVILFKPTALKSQTINSWLTTGDQNSLLEVQNPVNFNIGTATSRTTVGIDTTTFFQSIDGFGYALTEGSAEVISFLSPAKQNELLNDLFNPISGLGVSVLRISIGASDLNAYAYSYDDISSGTDLNMDQFSLAGPDMDYTIPILKKILAINPKIKILGSPWSAPKWMKTTDTWIGSKLDTNYYAAYAKYFVKYIGAMKDQGINIWGITVQNEPENPYNNPSMLMTADEQFKFIDKNLGPAFFNAGYKTKIIAFDHNCDNTSFPTYVCRSPFVDGSAFHLYKGTISALSSVHSGTGKNVYFTEQWTSSESIFQNDLSSKLSSIMIGSTQNWAKIALMWNLATDVGYGPFTSGGCDKCMGAITINDAANYTRNLSYYIVAHMSKVVKQGARRIVTNISDSELSAVSFMNSDGSIAMVVANTGTARKDFTTNYGGKNFSYSLEAKSAASLIWGMKPVGISEAVAADNVQIYPNPVNNLIMVKVDVNSNSNYEVKLFNCLGESAALGSYLIDRGNTDISIDIKELPSGIYFLKLYSKNTVICKRIVKN